MRTSIFYLQDMIKAAKGSNWSRWTLGEKLHELSKTKDIEFDKENKIIIATEKR